ncbi:PREDICTED: zinc finger protein 335-like [Priapulus caudatus]|uniref:Zinc finger protein 335-like n=1 Tax=Priapulus caudatus TaxID=37621 RepID=A0ABM1EIR9_PRICU|nr:PREDICTED: zinc finger protein 335-like [Priapulus caudatus]XP_014672091.1 PREDICTED: zinc finger protein 335-like [Priapulus caudatus]
MREFHLNPGEPPVNGAAWQPEEQTDRDRPVRRRQPPGNILVEAALTMHGRPDVKRAALGNVAADEATAAEMLQLLHERTQGAPAMPHYGGKGSGDVGSRGGGLPVRRRAVPAKFRDYVSKNLNKGTTRQNGDYATFEGDLNGAENNLSFVNRVQDVANNMEASSADNPYSSEHADVGMATAPKRGTKNLYLEVILPSKEEAGRRLRAGGEETAPPAVPQKRRPGRPRKYLFDDNGQLIGVLERTNGQATSAATSAAYRMFADGEEDSAVEQRATRGRRRGRKKGAPCVHACEVCGKTFSQKGNLRTHALVHSTQRPHPCPHCAKAFKSDEALRRHLLTHSEVKPFACSVCDAGFCSAASLEEHEARHTNTRRHRCDVCARRFRQASCLRRHAATHGGAPAYACDTCGRRFTQLDYLRSHTRTHTGERPFACDVCRKAFAHRSDVKRHRLTHFGHKPYVCATCGAAFKDPSSCRRHEREHSNAKPYVCQLCADSFKRAGQLKAHLFKKHFQSDAVTVVKSRDNTLQFIYKDGAAAAAAAGGALTDNGNDPEVRSHHEYPETQRHHTLAPESKVESEESEEQIICIVQDGSDSDPQILLQQQGEEEEDGDVAVATDAQTPGEQDGVTRYVIHVPADAAPPQTNNDAGITQRNACQRVTTLPRVGRQPSTAANTRTTAESNHQVALQPGVRTCDGDLCEAETSVVTLSPLENVTTAVQASPNKVTTPVPCPTEVTALTSYANEVTGTSTPYQYEVASPTPCPNKIATPVDPPPCLNEVATPTAQPPCSIEVTTPTAQPPCLIEVATRTAQPPCLIEVTTPTAQPPCLNEVATLPHASDEDFVNNPDFASQEYYDWLSRFTDACKMAAVPLEAAVFASINQVHKSLSDELAMPCGVVAIRENFRILMGITKDLHAIANAHLDYVMNSLDDTLFS